jgi:predicted O-linked N-acetylglucosamine transferase (SPINDLY family)
MGADFIDYIVADPVVIPESQRRFYSESVIFLPNSYQPNDDRRGILETDRKRADFGLPEGAFVFCCFNNNYKISAREFDIWMRLLSKVDNSVLWLLASNIWSEQNLRMEAQRRGIDPARLIFAGKVSHAEHLARQKHADLFLDTFNVNAHTTASDALWGGLPVVTKIGKQFSARVAASLLFAVGLPDLVTETEEAYEKLILALATDSEKLRSIKARLAENRVTEPLFDTKRYTADFERGLEKAFGLYLEGRKPEDIRVQ